MDFYGSERQLRPNAIVEAAVGESWNLSLPATLGVSTNFHESYFLLTWKYLKVSKFLASMEKVI